MMDMKGLALFNEQIKQAVEEEKFPGAVLLAGRRGETLLHEAYGWAQLSPTRDPMTKDTSFDIASLSKMTGTWPAILRLLQNGKLTLHDTLAEMLDRPMHPALKEVTLWNLLTHTAGLIPDCWPDKFGKTRDERINGLLSVEPVKPRGGQVLYSDLSFIFLGAIIEQQYG
ncbi:MAG: beta-lactamase family protein, partial [Clostridia bacterium]|nr:beta-lactamase family protein [Clostridia bacterium]